MTFLITLQIVHEEGQVTVWEDFVEPGPGKMCNRI